MPLQKPSPELEALVRTKCNENVETTDQDLKTIKEWLKKQPHLPDTWDDEMIIGFLRNCNFSVEKTKTKLDKYFSMKNALPEMFANRNFKRPDSQAVLSLVQVGSMPRLTSDGYRVNVARIIASENDNFEFSLVPKLLLMISDIYLKTENVAVAGDIFVLDASVFYFKYLVQITPALAKKFFSFVQNALAIKIKQVHVIRTNALVDYFLKFLTPFLKDKIRKRIYLHQNLDTLFDHVPKSLLPEEFGGTAEKLEKYMSEMMNTIEKNNTWLNEQEDFKADESQRVGKAVGYEDLFGLDGSFKKLGID